MENAILGSADLLVRMIEEAIFIDHTHILFLSLITTTDPSVSGSRTLQSQGALNVSSSRIPPVNHSNASINSYSAEFTVPIILDALLGRLVNESTPVFQQRAIIEVLHAFTVKALARPMRPVSMEELNAGSMVGSGGNSLNSLSSLVADDDVPDDVANEMNLLNIASGVCHFLAVRMDVVCNVLLQIHKQYTLNQKNPDCMYTIHLAFLINL